MRNMRNWNTVACSGAFRRIANACSATGETRVTHTPGVLPNMKPRSHKFWKAPKIPTPRWMLNYVNVT